VGGESSSEGDEDDRPELLFPEDEMFALPDYENKADNAEEG